MCKLESITSVALNVSKFESSYQRDYDDEHDHTNAGKQSTIYNNDKPGNFSYLS